MIWKKYFFQQLILEEKSGFVCILFISNYFEVEQNMLTKQKKQEYDHQRNCLRDPYCKMEEILMNTLNCEVH